MALAMAERNRMSASSRPIFRPGETGPGSDRITAGPVRYWPWPGTGRGTTGGNGKGHHGIARILGGTWEDHAGEVHAGEPWRRIRAGRRRPASGRHRDPG